MQKTVLHYKIISSPVGKLTLIASAKGLRAVLFESDRGRQNLVRMEAEGSLIENADNKILCLAESQLAEYFAGKRSNFKIALDMQGTVFQQNAWRALQTIPYGKTLSYGAQAAQMGDVKKARAAGMANGRNPLAIIVPCHRVIGASGSLTGFGGGLPTKQFLLELEQKHAA